MTRPKLQAPPGACDTHMHFYQGRFPSAPTALFTPPDAWVDDYQALQHRLGLDRVVVVQPSAYGLDNTAQLEAMAALGGKARGVMVVDANTTEAELDRLTGLGVCGARFFMLAGGAVPWDILEDVAARVHAFGWHIQLQLNGRDLPQWAALLKRLPCDLVVDHVGRYMPPVATEHESFQTLLSLLNTGRCWVKLSAPYESSVSGAPDFADVRPLARALVKAAPERMLWASNWPHPGWGDKQDDTALLDLLLDWVDDDATRRRILVDNPARLYGF